MPDLHTVAVFAVAAFFFAVVPGPAVLFIVTRSLDRGRTAGVVSALGIANGNLVHVAAATLGLSALLMSSTVVFAGVKYLGAAYLVYLGIRTILRREENGRPNGDRLQSLRALYTQGVVVATLNPKTALFFLAFLPQFVDPSKGSTALQIAVLGTLLVAITALSDSCYALLSGSAGAWLRGNRRGLRGRRLLSGGVYIALGVSAALAGSKPKSG